MICKSTSDNFEREWTSPPGLVQSFVSIDPGRSTGFVVVKKVIDENGQIDMYVSMIETISLQEAFELVNSINPSKIIIERMPTKIEVEMLAHYVDMLKLAQIYLCEFVLPGSWKPLAKTRKWKYYLAKTDHEQDAYNMLRWWFLKETKIDIGELKCQE